MEIAGVDDVRENGFIAYGMIAIVRTLRRIAPKEATDIHIGRPSWLVKNLTLLLRLYKDFPKPSEIARFVSGLGGRLAGDRVTTDS